MSRRQGVLLSLICLVNFTSAANLTSLVNLFIGTASGANGGSGGNAFPGAAVPHAMVKVWCRASSKFVRLSFPKVGIDVDETPRQAGYIADNSSVTGMLGTEIVLEK